MVVDFAAQNLRRIFGLYNVFRFISFIYHIMKEKRLRSLLICEYGNKIAFFLVWFILGYNLMGFLMPTVNQIAPEVVTTELYQTLLPIAGGLLLALLGFSIEKLCVGGICFALVMVITVRYFGAEMQTLAIGGIVGIVAAGAAVMMMKPATIIATAVAGAYALTLAILVIFPDISKEIYYFPILGGLALIGSVFQFLTTKRVS